MECRLLSRLPHSDPSFSVAAPEVDCPAYAAVVPIRMLELRNTGEYLMYFMKLGSCNLYSITSLEIKSTELG